MRKTICMVLVLGLVFGCFAMPVNGSEDPLGVKDYGEFGEVITEEPEIPEEAAAVPAEEPEEEPVAEPAAELLEAPETEPESEETEATVPVETEPVPEETAAPEVIAEETEPVPEETQEQIDAAVHPVPLYFQTDYPTVRFGSGMVSNNGCSITALAMVATYMTGHTYLPDELARYFGGCAENNIDRLEIGSDTLRLPYKKAENWHETYSALQDGKLVILLVNSDSPFTMSQHFLVLTGINAAGKITVNDPYQPNYTQWDLKTGFAEGFTPGFMLQGYSGAWIYDPEAMPAKPFVYYEPEIVRDNSRYPWIELTQEEEVLLAKVIWAEARGECEEGQQAVAEVVLNRLVSDSFPDALYDVIYGEGQFRTVPFLKDAEPHQAQYEAIERALYGPNILPMDVYYFATYPTTEKVWGKIGGHIFCFADNG